MGENSKIEWTDHTFSPWHGCSKISPGCNNCYAASLAHRYNFDIWGPHAKRRKMSDLTWNKPLKWNKQSLESGEQCRVFCGSMCDVFEDHLDAEFWRPRLWDLISETTALTWMLLTKRPENVEQYMPLAWRAALPSHVWLLSSAEDQKRLTERWSHLCRMPARIRGLSCEPLIGPLDLKAAGIQPGDLSWLICGGESGNKARAMHPNWVRSLRDQCEELGIAFFLKQWGRYVTEAAFCDEHPPQGRIEPLWMREDGFVAKTPVSALHTDVAEKEEHTWVKAAKMTKKRCGNWLDGHQHLEFPNV